MKFLNLGEGEKVILSRGRPSVRGVQPAVIALLDQALISGTTLLIGMVVARGTTVEEFGGFSLVLVLLIWATGVHAAVVTSPYMYQWRQHPDAQQPLYEGSVLIQHLFIVLVVAVGVFLAGGAGFTDGLGGGVSLAAPLSVILMGTLVRDYARMTAYAHQSFSVALKLDLGVFFLQMALLVLFSAAFGLTLSLVLLAVGVPQLALSLSSLLATPARFRINVRHVRSTAAEHWIFGRWLLAASTVNILTRDAYPWLLATLFGVAAAGHYAAHASVAFVAGPAVVSLANYLAPVFAKAVTNRRGPGLARKADEFAMKIGGLCLVYCLGLAFVGEPLSALLYGEPLRGNVGIITGLAVALSLVAISSPFGICLYALERSDVNFGSSLASLLISAGIGVPLIWRFALPGVVVMAVIAALVDLVIKRVILRRLTGPAAAFARERAKGAA